MTDNPFVNEVFTRALELYLKVKDHNESPEYHSFFVVVIRTIVFIYGEIDIINPYITKNEFNMGGIDNNMTKYGFSEEKLQDFKQQFIEYEKQGGQKPNTAFLKIEEYLIDMFFCKMIDLDISPEEEEKFEEFLYIPSNTNSYMKQELENNLVQVDSILYYYKSKQYEAEHKFKLEEIHRVILTPEAYFLLGYNIDQLRAMNDQDLQKVNQQIYDFFKVDSTSDNKEEMLEKAINYYKRYGNRLTSGNGYVDLLLFLSIVATVLFIVVLFIFNYL